MSLVIRNSRELINPDTFRWKCLVFGLSGIGKTEFLSDAPNIGIAASETGQGKGLLTIARKGLEYVTPESYKEFEQFCSGTVFKDKESLGLDSLSDMCKTFIKDEALSIPRAKGASDKRSRGIPELDDYGVMGELTRRLLRKLLDVDKHIIVTATLKIQEPDSETGNGQFLMCPDLPGAMALGSCAMFDTVMCLKTRAKLRDPKDPKSRYVERYFVTQSDGKGLVAKCRSVVEGGKPLLAEEELFDLNTKQGTFPYLLDKIKTAYGIFYEQHKGLAPKEMKS